MLQRLQVLEEDRLERLLQQWLRIEADRPPFEIADTETTTTAELGGLKLHIKADRVDRYADGRHAILDYKTSKNLSLSGWESERPDAPQLPLYAAMSERPISSVLFAKLVAENRPWWASASLANKLAVNRKAHLLQSVSRVGEQSWRH